MSMSDFWKDFGLGLMNLFDLPGSMVRDAFAWENPLDQLEGPEAWVSSKNRATGADVLKHWGMEDPGMMAGMGVEMLLDPMMLVGGLGALKGAKMSAKLGPRYRTTFRKRIENLDDAGSIRVTDERRILPPSDPVERELLREIPPGSRRLDEGVEAMALETPQGGVVRVSRSPLGGGNIHPTDMPESAIVESMRIPDVEQMVPIRRHAVIRSDTATPSIQTRHPETGEVFPALGLTPPTPAAAINWRAPGRSLHQHPSRPPTNTSDINRRLRGGGWGGVSLRGSGEEALSSLHSPSPRSSWLRAQEGTTPSVWTGPHTSDFSPAPSSGAASAEAGRHGVRSRLRRGNWPETPATDEVVLRHLDVEDQRIIAPLLDAQGKGDARLATGRGVSDIQDSLGATHEEMQRAMINFHDAKRKLATPTPGHEAIQITHSPMLEEIPGGQLTAGQGSDIINAMDDAEKAAYVRRQAVVQGGEDLGNKQIHNQEFYAWKDQVERQGLNPWDVKDMGSGRKMHNLMLDPDTGRAVTNDPGAIRQKNIKTTHGSPTSSPVFREIGEYDLALEEAGRGGSGWHEPTVVDITSNRPIGKKFTEMIEDMIWDPLTTVTGHRARTRASVAGLDPGMYGKAMPYIAPVIPPSLRVGRHMLDGEEEELDVSGTL